jgi:hypothetical protein
MTKNVANAPAIAASDPTFGYQMAVTDAGKTMQRLIKLFLS